MSSKGMDYTLLTLVIIGAVNWGLIGFFRFDLVAFLFGDMSWLSRIVYALVGIGGLYLISVYGRILTGAPILGHALEKAATRLFLRQNKAPWIERVNARGFFYQRKSYKETMIFAFAHSGSSSASFDTLRTIFT